MSKSYKTKSVAIIDNGIFGELARTLSRDFGKTYYMSPWVSAFPSSYQVELGEGFASIDRVDDVWEIIDDVDLFVFPDIYQGPLQEYLSGRGMRVWGSRSGDELEIYRTEAKEHFDELGIPQAPYEVIRGLSKLREYIKKRGDDKLWVKINQKRRGDTETFSVQGYDLFKNVFDRLEMKFGPVAEYQEFIVEDDLPETLDLAIDTYSVDGLYPSSALLGNEQKAEGYVGVVKAWNRQPPKVREIYETISPTLRNYRYRNFFSLEIRTGKGDFYLTDPCCRAGSPLLELELNMIDNVSEILWHGAVGELVEPEYKGKYGCEVVLSSDWVRENPLHVEFPEKYRDQIKFRYASKFGEETWIMPQSSPFENFGAVVACGNDLEDCFEEVREISQYVKGVRVNALTGSIESLKKNLKSLEDVGITF